jgi:hypothetical protein
MTTTPEQIEAVALAMWMADVEPYDPADRIPFEEAPETARAYCLAEAIAAINAMRPLIRAEVLEEAEAICREKQSKNKDAQSCADAIRALKEKNDPQTS